MVDYEKLSYDRYTYKHVQRLRKKGKKRGIDVPPLGFELTKPEKPRIAFWIVAIIFAVIFAAVLVGLFFLYNELVKSFTSLENLGELISAMFSPETFALTAGWSSVTGIMLVLIYILLIILCILPIFAAVYFYRFVRNAFYMARCSVEEFAAGENISSRILNLFVALAVVVAVYVICLMYVPEGGSSTMLTLIFVGLTIAMGGFLVLILVEKAKCKKLFEDLDEDKKQNFLEHDRALRNVKRRLKTDRAFTESFFK